MDKPPTPAADLPSLTLDVPAKLNLFLHVTGRRSDGYHLLESVFCTIGLYDRLTLTLHNLPGIRLFGGVTGLAQGEDLAVRAAQAVLSASGHGQTSDSGIGVDICLNKQIPTGAGLGGGSADAAYTLMGLNALLGSPLKHAQLHQIAVGLGADVPFFLFGQPAFVTGIGEILEPITLPALPIALIKPPVHIATPRIFSHPDLTRDCPAVKMSVFGFSDTAKTVAFVGQHTSNVLQPIAELLAPDVSQALSLFQQAPVQCRPSWSRMTGSGSAVFGVFVSDEQAQCFTQWVSQRVPLQTDKTTSGTANTANDESWFVWHGRTLQQSSLKDQMVQVS